jgi:hypothetical protein
LASQLKNPKAAGEKRVTKKPAAYPPARVS